MCHKIKIQSISMVHIILDLSKLLTTLYQSISRIKLIFSNEIFDYLSLIIETKLNVVTEICF